MYTCQSVCSFIQLCTSVSFIVVTSWLLIRKLGPRDQLFLSCSVIKRLSSSVFLFALILPLPDSQHICIKLSFSPLFPFTSSGSICLYLRHWGVPSGYARFPLTMNGWCRWPSDLLLWTPVRLWSSSNCMIEMAPARPLAMHSPGSDLLYLHVLSQTVDRLCIRELAW